MNQEELNEIVRLHGRWLSGLEGGARADLRDANLSGVNLTGADLSYADLRGADLSGADLRGANLTVADLSGADLRGANLSRAILIEANLIGAYLGLSNLSLSDLSLANLNHARLDLADLRNADLRNADLTGALSGPSYYSISWSGHGERGRRLHAVEQDGELVFSCGCFYGCEDDLRRYIEGEGGEEYKQSRLKALEIILELARAEGREGRITRHYAERR